MKKIKIKFLLIPFFVLISVFGFSNIKPVEAQEVGKATEALNNNTDLKATSGENTEKNTESVDAESIDFNLSKKIVLNDGRTVQDAFSTPADMVNLIVKIVFIASGIILFILIIGAGFTMIAGGSSDSTEKAKSTLTGAITGFIIMFAAYWIMQIISLVTGANIGF